MVYLLKIKDLFELAMANKALGLLAILLFIFFLVAVKKIINGIRNRHYSRIERLLWKYKGHALDFEYFIADLYERMGYDAEVTSGSHDGGKDIILTKGRKTYVVEVKCYEQSSKISREKIQKLHSAMIDSDADGAIFVTTSDFSQEALNYAEKHNIVTVNGTELSKMIKNRV